MEQARYKYGAGHKQIRVALSLQWKLVEFRGLSKDCGHCKYCRHIADIADILQTYCRYCRYCRYIADIADILQILQIYCKQIAADCRRLLWITANSGGKQRIVV